MEFRKKEKLINNLTILLCSTNLIKGKLRLAACLLVFMVTVGSILFVNTTAINNIAFAGEEESKFNESDFIIKDVGVGDEGNPFLTVEGTAGGTIPQKENLAYAYVFVTDNGTYTVTSDWMYTKWHTHGITLDENNCVVSMNNSGDADVRDLVKVIKTNVTKVDKVMTTEFTINKSDGSFCASKIFDSAP